MRVTGSLNAPEDARTEQRRGASRSTGAPQHWSRQSPRRCRSRSSAPSSRRTSVQSVPPYRGSLTCGVAPLREGVRPSCTRRSATGLCVRALRDGSEWDGATLGCRQAPSRIGTARTGSKAAATMLCATSRVRAACHATSLLHWSHGQPDLSTPSRPLRFESTAPEDERAPASPAPTSTLAAAMQEYKHVARALLAIRNAYFSRSGQRTSADEPPAKAFGCAVAAVLYVACCNEGLPGFWPIPSP